MLKESLLAAALTFPAWHGDKEPDEERRARLETIVQAIDDAVGLATCRDEPKNTEREESDDSASPARSVPTSGDAGPKTPATGDVGEVDDPVETDAPAVPASDESKSARAERDRDGHAKSGDGDSTGDEADGESTKPCQRLWRGDPRELGFLLLTQAFFETRLARHVHEGNCRTEIGECDSGRATSLWQLQAGYHLPVERWETLAGVDLASTRAAAFEAARALSRAKNYCRTLEGAISNYATGSRCRWKDARLRANFTRRLIYRY